MFKVVHKTDVLRVIATRDSLAAAIEEAYAHSEALGKLLAHDACWVEVRDVKDVVLRRVNHGLDRHRDPGRGDGA